MCNVYPRAGPNKEKIRKYRCDYLASSLIFLMRRCCCFRGLQLPRSLRCAGPMRRNTCLAISSASWSIGRLINRIRSECSPLKASKKFLRFWRGMRIRPSSCRWSSKLLMTSHGGSDFASLKTSRKLLPTSERKSPIWVSSRPMEICWRILRLMSRYRL